MTIAVIGASGVVGRALLDMGAQAGLDAVGLSRRAPDLPGVRHVSLDLMDADACRASVAEHLSDATHVVYAALYEEPGLIAGWRHERQMQTNLSMLQHLMEPLLENNRVLRHVSLLQGTKAYGAHIMPMKVPGREREARVEHDNFYWLQEDYLTDLRQGQSWSTTVWRPQIIFGHALGAPMNILAAIGAYATLCRFRGKGLAYPGGPSGVQEAIDADLLARAILHSFDNDAFANETFNVTNGDVYTWQNVWPAITSALDMEAASPERQSLAQTCDDEDEWRTATETFGLQKLGLRELVGDSFFYADALMNVAGEAPPPPALVSTVKLRQAGFHECIDTEDMLAGWFRRLREMRILP